MKHTNSIRESLENNELNKDNVLSLARTTTKSRTIKAYDTYTRSIISLRSTYVFPLDSETYDRYNKLVRSAKASLSQELGAANKIGKGVILQFYAYQLAKEPGLDMSVREVNAIFKEIIGRTINQNLMAGLYKREKNSISPFFTEHEYRKKIFKHHIIIELREKMDEFELYLEQWRDTRKNPFQAKLDIALGKK